MKNEPQQKDVIFVIFGATGDLALRYIFPALEKLLSQGIISDRSKIIAVSRRDWGDAEFISHLGKGGREFLDLVSYSRVDMESGEGYVELRKKIKALSKEIPGAELLVHLSVAPQHQEAAVKALCEEKILSSKAKLLIEKPFGTDEGSAKSLDSLLSSCVKESQVYRVDHYLGKDTMRAIMDLHESTSEFSRILTSETVRSIRVALLEKIGIEGRGASYDHVGAFRDVGQNHVLEMLAVLAADVPKKSWQRARADVLEHLAPPEKTCEFSRRGQYEGYKSEKGVREDSETETAFEVMTSLSAGKLKGVPVTLQSGKKLPAQGAFIEVLFHEMSDMPVRMRFDIQPEQEIVIDYAGGKTDRFEIKKQNDAYTNVLKAAIMGSSREFAGGEEIEALWRYADHIVACWKKVPLEIYSADKPFLIE